MITGPHLDNTRVLLLQGLELADHLVVGLVPTHLHPVHHAALLPLGPGHHHHSQEEETDLAHVGPCQYDC